MRFSFIRVRFMALASLFTMVKYCEININKDMYTHMSACPLWLTVCFRPAAVVEQLQSWSRTDPFAPQPWGTCCCQPHRCPSDTNDWRWILKRLTSTAVVQAAKLDRASPQSRSPNAKSCFRSLTRMEMERSTGPSSYQ